MHIAYLSGHP